MRAVAAPGVKAGAVAREERVVCGIFGVVRAAAAAHPERASEAFVALGHLAEQRGRDAAGFALVGGGHDGGPRDLPPNATSRRDVALGGCRVVKDTVPWSLLWRRRYLARLDLATVALGHTRAATQGAPGRRCNASPLAVGRLVGVHNGDVDTAALRLLLGASLPEPAGGTDSEVLYLALDRFRDDPAGVAALLSGIVGRAALAWVDRSRPGRVWLARAALSPLATARDAEGNLYWASDPGWFRHVERSTDGRVTFRVVERVPEGTLRTIATRNVPAVVEEASFTPLARAADLALAAIWRGLADEDAAAFEAEARHRVVPRAATPTAVTRGARGPGRPPRSRATATVPLARDARVA
jgi:asparagine synthetase B (glutamine-hydrolysing)